MKTAIFVYSKLTGKLKFIKHLHYIEDTLKSHFDSVLLLETKTIDELKEACHLAATKYDYFFFIGGDGTINAIFNFLAKEDKKPILGYLPGGTTNDFAHNFGLKKNIKKTLNSILNGEAVSFDVCKANDVYFSYVLAVGAYTEISYVANRKAKEKIGSLAYYGLAFKDAFKKTRIKGELIANNKKYKVNAPFLLILNSNHVGGFYVNMKNKVNDGKFTIFITKPGLFNGILHYMFFKARTEKIYTDHFIFKFDNDSYKPWCLDGERKDLGNVDVTCLHNFYKLLVSNKIAKKINK